VAGGEDVPEEFVAYVVVAAGLRRMLPFVVR
jgi:hypothetical protein